MHWIGIIFAFGIFGVSFFFIGTAVFFFLFGMSLIVGIAPFVVYLIYEASVENEKGQMFLEFTRNLVESVKTGTPISKSIVNVKDKSYGVLSDHIKKLANQINIGIPLERALKIFARDVDNKVVTRAIILIGQAEKSGGNIGEILEAVAKAVSTSDKLKKERKAVISSLVVQGYIIFFIFMVIILILQFQIIPMILGIGDIGGIAGGATGGRVSASQLQVSNAFLYLVLVQGFFSGIAIGKLAEKEFKAGLKHSFILMIVAFLVSSISNFFFGG